MSGRGLEFLSWFKRSPGVGDGGAAGLLWLDHCPWHQQSLGMTLHFVLLLFLLAKRGCSQAGQSTVRMGGGGRRMGKTHWGSSLLPAESSLALSKPSRNTEGLDILICKMGSRG